MNRLHVLLAAVILPTTIGLGGPTPAGAQSALTEHTVTLDDDEARYTVDIKQANWLVGTWRGNGFGGTVEEVWLPAAHGQMIGTFRHHRDDDAGFSEIMSLGEFDGQTLLRVKHFNPDFTGWETQEESVDFRFVNSEFRTLRFRGLTLVSPAPDRLEVYIAMRGSDGELREERLQYRRVMP